MITDPIRNSQAPGDAVDQFRQAIENDCGTFDGDLIPDGRPYRFHVHGDKPGERNLFVKMFADGEGGVYQWLRQHDKTLVWQAKRDKPLTAEEKRAFRKRIERERAEAARRTAEKQAKATARAQEIWNAARPATEHPYATRKRCGLHGVRVGTFSAWVDGQVCPIPGALLVPLRRGGKPEVVGVQAILPDANNPTGLDKIFPGNTPKRGSYHPIGRPTPGGPIVFAEGYATAASIHEATGHPCVVCFDRGNLRPVVEDFRARYPDRRFVVAADNDAWTRRQDGTPWNPGLESALKIANGDEDTPAVQNVRVAVPVFVDTTSRPTDFNDLAALETPERVAEIIAAALADHAPQAEPEPPQDDYDQCPPPEYYDGAPMDDTPPAGRRKPQKAAPTEPHLVMARRVLAALGVGNVRFWQSRFWRWDGGVWRPFDDRAARQIIHDVCGAEIKSRSTVDSVLDLAKTEAFADLPASDQDGRVVNVRNGELHWTGDRWDFRPHDRERFSTSQIPVDHDPQATAPRFEQFLGEVFRDDPDRLEKSVIACEAIGYSLLTTCEFEKFFLLIGAGANGKSVLLRLLQDLLGVENVSAVQPSQFDNRFQRAHLFGKLANIITEIAEGAEIADAQLKAIVSGELTTAERKMQPPFDFRPFSTCWFGTNHRPHTRDFSAALFRRAIVLEFNRVFEPHEQDQRLGEKLRAELAGVLNLALEAMAGVFARGGFTTAPSVEAAKASWRLEADQVAQFVEESCVLDPAGQISSGELYAAYGTWADESGIRRKLNRKNFTTRLLRFGVEPHKGTGGARRLAGISLASEVARVA